MSYLSEYQNWQSDPEDFWRQKASQVSWFKAPSTIISKDDNGLHEWFADGQLNTSYLALDFHIEQGRGDQAAIIYDSPVTNTQQVFTYQQLLKETCKLANAMSSLGVTHGDTVVIYMPMIPQTAIAMLACARLGAIHSVVFGGFAAPELASRIEDAKPKIVLSASCGIEINRVIEYKPLLDGALQLTTHQPEHCVIFQRPEQTAAMVPDRDLDWLNCVAAASEDFQAISVSGSHPLYILYTSGTTGKPKGVVRTNGGHAVALKYSMQAIYGMQPGDTFFSASDVGWVVGHSYIVYGPLLNGCTSIFYEGKPILTPDAGAFWRIIEQYKVNALFSAPTAFRAIKREDPDGELVRKYDITSLRHIFAAGERLDPPTQLWMSEKIGVDVIDNWWQTETGWPIAANMVGIEKVSVKYGSASHPIPGYQVEILDDQGQKLTAGKQGNIAIKLPLPPGCLSTLWGDPERYKTAYLADFPGYYSSGDGGYLDDDGYLFVMGRVDDVINVAGHRLSTGDIEEVLGNHPQVSECAVVAKVDSLKGEIPVGFIVTNSIDTVTNDELQQQLKEQLMQLIRKEIGALACYKESYLLTKLPKTRSGKILRTTIKQILNGEQVQIPPTIEDPAAVDDIVNAIQG